MMTLEDCSGGCRRGTLSLSARFAHVERLLDIFFGQTGASEADERSGSATMEASR